MTGLLFDRPEWLAPGLAFVAALGVLLVWANARTRRQLRTLLGAAAQVPARRRQSRGHTLRDAALVLALLLVLLGLLGPRFGRENVQLSTGGIDVVVVMDTSRSMDARDVPPSRLDAARRAALRLLAGLGPGDRAALAAFAGRGVLLTPLTSDHAALAEMLGAVETTLVKPGGSNLAGGIVASLSAFEPVDERPRAIVLLSDGESPGAPIDEGLVAAARANVQVFPVAFGTREGATIPDHGVPLRDSAGEIVTSRWHLRSLEAVADETGGRLFVTDEWGQLDVDAALRDLHAPVAAAPGEFVDHPVTVAVVVPFALAALLLLLLDWGVAVPAAASPSPGRRVGPTRSRRPIPVAAIALSVVSIAATPEPAGERPVPNAESLLRAGLEHAAEGAWERARASFLDAALTAKDPELRAIAYHDLGVAALRQDDLLEARNAFFDALSATTDRADADRVARTQWNLEWALERLTDEPPPAGPQPEARPDGQEKEARRSEPEAGAGDAQASQKPMPFEEKGGLSPRESRPLPESLPALDARERESLLSRIQDDPRRALLSASFEPHEDRRRRQLGSPTW